jgi:hypothetical protein
MEPSVPPAGIGGLRRFFLIYQSRDAGPKGDKVFVVWHAHEASRSSARRGLPLLCRLPAGALVPAAPYPWVCGRCAREFERRNLCELTVHHIDHDHGNNPRDGSNWELLCIYCHDEEHRKFENFVRYRSSTQSKAQAATYKPFAGLRAKMEGRI